MHLKGYQLSILLILVGGILFTSGVYAILHESDFEVLPAKISVGQNNIFAIKKENNCLLSIEASWVKQPEGSSIYLTGRLPGDADNSQPFLKGELSFNQFDQFFGSVFEFPKISQSEGKFLKVGSQGVTPIDITILGQIFDRPLSFKISAKGPVTLVRIKDALWISAPKSQNINSTHYKNQITNNNISFISLNNLNECISDGKIEFNLPGVMQSFLTLMNDLKASSLEGGK